MTTSTSGAKLRVTGLFRAAYRWLRDEPQPHPPAPAAPPPPARPPAPQSPPPAPSSGAKPQPAPPRIATAHTSDTIHLPLQPILDLLAAELKAKQRQQTVGALTIPVSVSKVMAQLPKGTVKLTFGELRLAAPGVFQLATDCDHVPVTLPLNEVLKQVSLTKLVRRADQRVVAVPDEIGSPFGENGKGLVLSPRAEQTPAFSPPARAVTPAAPAPPVAPTAFPRGLTPVPSPSSDTAFRARTPASLPTPPKPAIPLPLPKPSLPSSLAPSRMAVPLDAPKPANPPSNTGGNGRSTAPAPAQVPPSSVTELNAAEIPVGAMASSSPDAVQVPLLNLMNTWPQAIRLEIAQLNLMDAKLVVPVAVLEKGLRQGKVEFPWKLVRAWIRPEVRSVVTTNDALVLELPLSVIAPLFVARHKHAAKAQRRVAVDDTIPNLFFGFPQGEAAPGVAAHTTPVSAPVAAKSPDTNFYTWGESEDDRPKVAADVIPASNTEFLRRFATPKEIVGRAASLEGVAGALVALPDGLAVASRVPPSFNPDTLAAFLPQIFAKVSQCTKELRMGTLNNLNFTVGNVPWKIFRVNNVFFAAFGRAEEPLPTAQLAALAAELDRKPKAA